MSEIKTKKNKDNSLEVGVLLTCKIKKHGKEELDIEELLKMFCDYIKQHGVVGHGGSMHIDKIEPIRKEA